MDNNGITGITILVGGWPSYPSEKYESKSMGFGWHPFFMKWKRIQSCLKPPTSDGWWWLKVSEHLKKRCTWWHHVASVIETTRLFPAMNKSQKHSKTMWGWDMMGSQYFRDRTISAGPKLSRHTCHTHLASQSRRSELDPHHKQPYKPKMWHSQRVDCQLAEVHKCVLWKPCLDGLSVHLCWFWAIHHSLETGNTRMYQNHQPKTMYLGKL